jgi:hypothetical protein
MRCVKDVFLLSEGGNNSGLKPVPPVAEGVPPLFWHYVEQLADNCHHATHNLNARCTVRTNFIKCKDEEILPDREGHYETKCVLGITESADFEPATAKPDQKIFNLVERLHRSSRIIDGGRIGL